MRADFLSILTWCILFTFYGCGEKTEVEPIKAHYTSEFPDKEINLTKKLDDKILLLSESKQDTIQLSILYNKARMTNTIIDDTTKDTLFDGKVYKHGRLHYLCSKIRDSVFWISAIKIKKDRIQGLGTERWQMRSLDELLDTNQNAALHKLVAKNKPDYAITPDKKIVSAYYESIIDSFPVLYRIRSKDIIETEEDRNREEIVLDTASFEDEMLPVLKRHYPNPVEEVLHLETNYGSDYKLILTDAQGKTIITDQFSGFSQSLGLKNIPSGIYLLHLSSDELRQKETVRIWVK